METESIPGADGAPVTVHTTGSGPGLVVLHGGGVTWQDYRRLATALSEGFTVHLYNRRGRADSVPLTGDETLGTDLDDLAAVLDHTGARNVFGHSGGGFVALRAGLRLPLERIAVFDPGLSISGRPSFAFLEPFERAVRAGQPARAMTLMARAVHPDDVGAKLPFGLALALTALFLRTPIGRRFTDLLPTMPPEVRRIADQDGPAADYAGIPADVLLASGADSPRYFAENCQALAAAIPRGQAVVVPGSHNAANLARPAFVRPFLAFFAGRTIAPGQTRDLS